MRCGVFRPCRRSIAGIGVCSGWAVDWTITSSPFQISVELGDTEVDYLHVSIVTTHAAKIQNVSVEYVFSSAFCIFIGCCFEPIRIAGICDNTMGRIELFSASSA